MNINVAIVGIGNCASALYQGLHFYKNPETDSSGLLRTQIGKYYVEDIHVVVAFDIDKRKVGKTLKDAIFSEPNCTPVYQTQLDDGPIVQMGNLLDGVSPIMDEYNDSERFIISDTPMSNMKEILLEKKVDMLINYLPVGSQLATEFLAELCLDTGISLLNCIPVFIASNPKWSQRFIDKKIPLIGDDMKSQFGASIVSQMLQEVAISRGIKIKAHIQRNIGGNTDFLNMTDKDRVSCKKISKENVINNVDPNNDCFIHAGPSEYIRYYKDNKIANIHMEMEGFMKSKIDLELRLSVIDSPNSAGVVIDAIRYLKIARDIGHAGPVIGASSFTQKTPPKQLSLEESIKACDKMSCINN